jgi:hypothetical protein
MKQVVKDFTLKTSLTFLMIALLQTIIYAQEQGSSTSSTTTTTKSMSVSAGSDWYASPWVWVVGAVVFILLLVALMRGGSRSNEATTTRTDKVTVTKSTSLD